jgi:hypothetical protein
MKSSIFLDFLDLEEEVGSSTITGEMTLLFLLLLCGVEDLVDEFFFLSLGWGFGSNLMQEHPQPHSPIKRASAWRQRITAGRASQS